MRARDVSRFDGHAASLHALRFVNGGRASISSGRDAPIFV